MTVLRVPPALRTCHEARRVREHQTPRRHAQMEARLWALHVHHAGARRARSRHRQRVCLWVRHARQTGVVHVSEQTKHRRESATDPLCVLDHGACHRSHGPWRRVRLAFFAHHVAHVACVYRTVALMIDYADKAKNPSISTARQVLTILQTHYPERLGAAIIAHLPWLLYGFYKLINPFIDPVTRAKMVFNPVPDDGGLWRSAEARDQGQDDAKLFEPDQLVSDSWLGSAAFKYTHEAYWPALLSMSETRKKDMTRVWRELGGVIGIKEWDVKVGVRDGLTVPDKVVDLTGQAL
jgi:hypothetical protein